MQPPQITQQVKIRRIKSASLFKVIFVIFLVVFTPFLIGCGIAAVFGAQTIYFQHQPVTGILGLVTAIVMIPIFSGIFGSIAWFLSYIAIRLVGHFTPLTIEYVSDENPSS